MAEDQRGRRQCEPGAEKAGTLCKRRDMTHWVAMEDGQRVGFKG